MFNVEAGAVLLLVLVFGGITSGIGLIVVAFRGFIRGE